jgi:hypothetical protein
MKQRAFLIWVAHASRVLAMAFLHCELFYLARVQESLFWRDSKTTHEERRATQTFAATRNVRSIAKCS